MFMQDFISHNICFVDLYQLIFPGIFIQFSYLQYISNTYNSFFKITFIHETYLTDHSDKLDSLKNNALTTLNNTPLSQEVCLFSSIKIVPDNATTLTQ